jgi:hypothetical protein
LKIRFACPGCERPSRAHVSRPADWQCPECDHLLRLAAGLSAGEWTTCPICGNGELYKKKNFPHWLGLSILTVASGSFFLLQLYYHPWLAWAILIGSAILDGGLYLWVGDAIVCYRCGAQVLGLTGPAPQPPFDLGIAERYRQERLRRQQLQKEKGIKQP